MHSHDLEDLVAAGNVGLMQAARSFDPGRGVKFETHARRRIIGAAIDSIRAQFGRHHPDDTWPRRRIRPDTDLQGEADESPLELIAGDGDPDDTDHRVRRVRERVVARLARELSVRTAKMAAMRYVDRMTLRAVGEAFGITESRTLQILNPLAEHVVSLIEQEVRREVIA